MKRTVTRTFLIFLCSLVLFSCSHGNKDCKGVYEDYKKAYGELPSGALYTKSAREWEDGYMTKELFSSLYEGQKEMTELDLIEDCVIYLSSSPYFFGEIGIFLCYGNADTEAVAKMCHRRISLVSELKNLSGRTLEDCLENAKVLISGRYVIYSVMPDKRASERALGACLK